jgi:transposase
MDANQLPTDPDELRRLLLSAQQALKVKEQSLAIAQEQNKLLASTISEQQQKLEQKEQLILELLRALRGKQRERVNPDQLLLFEIGELESMIKEEAQQEEEATTTKPRKKKGHGRRLIPDGLPEEIVLHELSESERLCPHDGQPMPVIRWEESKQLDFVPSKLKVIVHRRAIYACPTKHDEATIITAPKPPEPVEKGLASAGLLAHVVISKFGDHLPGYRMEDIFAR